MDYINNIRKLRKDRGYSQADIAEVLETTQQHYSCYENGKNELPIRHLIKLCMFYNVTSDSILGLTQPQDSQTAVMITADALSHEISHFVGKRRQEVTEGYYEVE